MRVFAYAGTDRAGNAVSGVVEATNRVTAIRLLQEQHINATKVETALNVIPKSQGARRDPITGRFQKQHGTKEATQCIAKDVIEQPMLDKVGDLSAQITFKNLYKVENSKLEKVDKVLLMKMEFDQTGLTREATVSEKYCFVPNNMIEDVAKNLPGATISTRYFDSLYYGTLTQESLSIQITNSYGGFQAFRMTPILKIDDVDIPIFVSTKQIHHGSASGLETAIKETLTIAGALNDGKQQLLEVLNTSPSADEWQEFDAKLSATAKNTTRQLPKQIGKKYDNFRATNTEASYADLLKFIVHETKAYMDAKKFSPGVEKRSVEIINSILAESKIAAELTTILEKNVDLDTAKKAAKKIAREQQKHKTTAIRL